MVLALKYMQNYEKASALKDLSLEGKSACKYTIIIQNFKPHGLETDSTQLSLSPPTVYKDI